MFLIDRSNKLAISVTNSPGEVYSCDGVDFEKVFSLPQSKTKSTDIKFSPLNDDLLYSSSLDGTIKLWDLRSGNNKPVNIFQGKYFLIVNIKIFQLY